MAARAPAGTVLTGISSMATRQILADLCEQYQRETGVRVEVEAVGGVDAARRVLAGEVFDLVVLADTAIEQLAAAGKVDPAGRIELVRSTMVAAVRAGAPQPDLASPEAVRQAVLGARRIGYSSGPSGVHLQGLFAEWGIAEKILPRTVQASPGVPVGSLIAEGKVDLGFQQLSELMDLPGVEVIGPLPPPIGLDTGFVAAPSTATGRSEAVRDFLSFLGSPATAAAKRRRGLAPGRVAGV